MIDLAIRLLDLFALAVLGAAIAGAAWLLLDFVRDARVLDDPSWLDTPGGRNDRARLLGDPMIRPAGGLPADPGGERRRPSWTDVGDHRVSREVPGPVEA